MCPSHLDSSQGSGAPAIVNITWLKLVLAILTPSPAANSCPSRIILLPPFHSLTSYLVNDWLTYMCSFGFIFFLGYGKHLLLSLAPWLYTFVLLVVCYMMAP